MPVDLPLKGHFSIADWTVEPELNAISKDGDTIHLEPKVMKVLLHLAMASGQVLSKEDLIQAVWPDTFVSDDVLTRCISVLRREMQDDPHAPRYIQTIPKAGYRLVAEVHSIVERPAENHSGPEHPIFNGAAHGSREIFDHAPPSATAADAAAAVAVPHPPKRRQWPIWTAASALAVAVILSLTIWRFRVRNSLPALNVLPLTSYTGQQDQGAFSPDGTRVVFVWSKPGDGNRNLFIKQTDSETLLRLTNGPESDYSPVWSPDGTKIAYLADTNKGLGLYVISSLGGPPQKIYTPQGIVHWEQRALSWSPDGKSLVFPDGEPASIHVLSLDTLQTRTITTPPHVWDGDADPMFSPDGKLIAFVRAIDGAVRDIYVVPVNDGTPRQITFDRRLIDSLTWTSKGNAIIFSSDRGGEFALWKVSLRGGQPQRLPVGTEDAYQPAVSLHNHLLLYSESSATWSILGIRLHSSDADRRQDDRPVAVVSSTEQDSAPAFAPDGSRFAFQSWRSGSQELWIASRDGQTLRQLTYNGRGLTGSPSFSPDGQQVAFDARPEGHSHIFVISTNGGTPRQITSGNSNDILPRWSADGKFLYFASNRTGDWQSWKVPVAGGQPQQVTTTEGYLAMESPDGKWVYYTKGNTSGIWRIPTGGGPEVRIAPQPPDGYWGYWAVTQRGVYFLDAAQPQWRIQLYDPATKRISTVATLDRHPPPFSGISVNDKENELLITDEFNASSHITLVQNFP